MCPGRLLATFLCLLPLAVIASSNIWKYFSFKSISFYSGLVVVVDGVVVIVVVEDGMMVCWAKISGTPGLSLKEFSRVGNCVYTDVILLSDEKYISIWGPIIVITHKYILQY